MEAISLLSLWLCLPCAIPGAGQPAEVHAEDLALFPGRDCAIRERDAAFHRWQYAKWRYIWSESQAHADAEHWRAKREECYDAWRSWDYLASCYYDPPLRAGMPQIKGAGCVKDRLTSIYNAIGPARFYTGTLPGVVDLSEARVEAVPLP